MRFLPLYILLIMNLMACGGFQSEPQIPYDMMMANRGYEELVKENFDQAEAFFDVARSVNPNNPYALLNLGVVYQNTGRKSAAKQMYEKVIELNPNYRVEKSTNAGHKGKSLAEIAEINLRGLEK